MLAEQTNILVYVCMRDRFVHSCRNEVAIDSTVALNELIVCALITSAGSLFQ